MVVRDPPKLDPRSNTSYRCLLRPKKLSNLSDLVAALRGDATFATYLVFLVDTHGSTAHAVEQLLARAAWGKRRKEPIHRFTVTSTAHILVSERRSLHLDLSLDQVLKSKLQQHIDMSNSGLSSPDIRQSGSQAPRFARACTRCRHQKLACKPGPSGTYPCARCEDSS